jgi:hypothetical protein
MPNEKERVMIERLIQLASRLKVVEDVADVPHGRRGRHEPKASTQKGSAQKGSAGRLVRKGIPALVIGSVAVAEFRRRARQARS